MNSDQPLYPLQFQPLFRDYLWGGNRLRTVLGKDTALEVCAESWEIVDHLQGESVVTAGALAGRGLGSLMQEFGPRLVGQQAWQQIQSPGRPPNLRGRFPLLFKFLDARLDLSVQVHPDDELAGQLTPPDLGKSEAWYVMDAEPGSKIYAGVRTGVDESQFRAALEAGNVAELLHCFEPRAGDCIYIPAGTLHAIGAGLLVAEIQQASDTTFRLFDWNRRGADGRPRALHIDQGLKAAKFLGPVNPVRPVGPGDEACQLLINSPYLQLLRRRLLGMESVGGDGRMRILVGVGGAAELRWPADDSPGLEPGKLTLGPGHTAFIPADCSRIELTSDSGGELLEICLPQPDLSAG